jgi:hypothetical protein
MRSTSAHPALLLEGWWGAVWGGALAHGCHWAQLRPSLVIPKASLRPPTWAPCPVPAGVFVLEAA